MPVCLSLISDALWASLFSSSASSFLVEVHYRLFARSVCLSSDGRSYWPRWQSFLLTDSVCSGWSECFVSEAFSIGKSVSNVDWFCLRTLYDLFLNFKSSQKVASTIIFLYLFNIDFFLFVKCDANVIVVWSFFICLFLCGADQFLGKGEIKFHVQYGTVIGNGILAPSLTPVFLFFIFCILFWLLGMRNHILTHMTYFCRIIMCTTETKLFACYVQSRIGRERVRAFRLRPTRHCVPKVPLLACWPLSIACSIACLCATDKSARRKSHTEFLWWLETTATADGHRREGLRE